MNSFIYNTPIGKIELVETNNKITAAHFNAIEKNDMKETDILKEAGKQLHEYFSGQRQSFDLPLNPQGTEFQIKVWAALQEIPYGKTATYKDIAQIINKPKGCRAVGMANNKNPLPIFIPCHRVIGTNGKLVGYAGGLSTKEKLLELEQSYL